MNYKCSIYTVRNQNPVYSHEHVKTGAKKSETVF
jgi:hypothetical protein